ncbi:hypothetical protein Bca101_101784 [Brassica carinata]
MLTLEPFSENQGRSAVHREDPANQLPYALRVYSPVDSHTCQTPWSVFQGGSNGEPTGRRPSTQMRGTPWRVLQTTIKAAASPRAPFHLYLAVLVRYRSRPYLALDGIYRPIGAAFPNNPTRRQRLRGATGSNTTGSHPLWRPFPGNLGPALLASLARILANACVTHGDQLPSDILERMGGRRFVTPRQTCPRRRLGAQLAFKDSMVHGILQFTPSIAFRSFFIDASEISVASRFRLYIAALPPNKHRLGLAKAGRLVECSLTLFVRGLVISGSYAYNPAKLSGDKRITTELVGKKSAKKPAHRE